MIINLPHDDNSISSSGDYDKDSLERRRPPPNPERQQPPPPPNLRQVPPTPRQIKGDENGINNLAKRPKKQISNTEYLLVTIVLGIIDLIQFILDIPPIVLVGGIINEILEPTIAFLYGFYLQLRNKGMSDIWTSGPLIVSFIVEAGTAGGAPLWLLDGLYNWGRARVLERASKIPGGGKLAAKVLSKKGAQTGGAKK